MDTLDHLIEVLTCRRKTNRWTLNTFFFMLDVIAYNSYALFQMKNSKEFEFDVNRKRRLFTEKLAIQLITPCMNARVENFSSKNFSGCQSPLMNSFRKAGATLLTKFNSSPENSAKNEKRKYCSMCKYEKNANRIKAICFECKRPICTNHSTIICNSCNLQH